MKRFLDLFLSNFQWYRRMIGGKWYLNAYRFDMDTFEVWEKKYFKEGSWPRTLIKLKNNQHDAKRPIYKNKTRFK